MHHAHTRMKIECGGLTFTSDFDSGNLDRVEFVSETKRLSDNDRSSLYSFVQSHAARNHLAFRSTAGSYSPRKKTQNVAPLTRPPPATAPKLGASSKCYQPLQTKKNYQVLEFQVWTKPDCSGTPYENQFRSWFHFGIHGGFPGCVVKIHIMNLNRQGKLYFYGMKPVYRVVPGKETWRRIPGTVNYKVESQGNFTINFMHPLSPQSNAILYFAFTYPFTYSSCQEMLDNINTEVKPSLLFSDNDRKPPDHAIYYSRELLCYSLDGLKVELLTITSFKGFTKEREARLPFLFPDLTKPRCHIFCDKRVIFISSRVHPGETPSSFVFNGFLRRLLSARDSKASKLREHFVFKLIPLLNPDGVHRGHFRTDSRGVNLNRTYLIADPELHPSTYAARSLLLYYHRLYSKLQPEDALLAAKVNCNKQQSNGKSPLFNHKMVSKSLKAFSKVKVISPTSSLPSVRRYEEQHSCDLSNFSFNTRNSETGIDRSLSVSDLYTSSKSATSSTKYFYDAPGSTPLDGSNFNYAESLPSSLTNDSPKLSNGSSQCCSQRNRSCSDLDASDPEEDTMGYPSNETKYAINSLISNLSPEASGIAFYIDLHGHACKRGCFIYGNHFADLEQQVECMLLPKLMSINCPYFDFGACNFSAENMQSGNKREGQSKEGSGRVALLTFTGITQSYTLECNYNTGRNGIFTSTFDSSPDKMVEYFSPVVYEQVGEALVTSLLDSAGLNAHFCIPRLTLSSIEDVKHWLRKHATSLQNKKKTSDFLKRNMLNAKMGRLGSKDKSTCSSPLLSDRFGNRNSHHRAEPKSSRFTMNTRKTFRSQPVTKPELRNFGLPYNKHFHSSTPSLNVKGTSKCFDSIKSLLNPKIKTFVPLNPAVTRSGQRKAKGNRPPADDTDLPWENTTESSLESQHNVGTPQIKKRASHPVLDELRSKKTSGNNGIQTTRRLLKPKKKGLLPSFQNSVEQTSSNLLRNEGNLRMKKSSKKPENC